MEVSIPNIQYQAQFDEIRLIIDTRKKRAYKALNNEIILSNWEIGRYVSDKIKSAKWGSKVIDMLVVYLKEKIPGIKGYEKRSIERMVRFYNEYSSVEFASAIPTQIYLEALDRDVKKENENPSIGILLCKSADSQVVEYALNRSLSPTMIAEYKRQLIPKEILQKHLKEILDK